MGPLGVAPGPEFPRKASGQGAQGRVRDDDYDFLVRSGTAGDPFAGIGTEAGRTYFLVLRATPTGGGNYDLVELWIDPDSVDPGLPDVTDPRNSGTGSLSEFIYRVANLDLNDTYYIDSIRIGNSFADVIPTAAAIPEPITLLLGAAGLGALGAYMRRRRG